MLKYSNIIILLFSIFNNNAFITFYPGKINGWFKNQKCLLFDDKNICYLHFTFISSFKKVKFLC